jgi:hypothetical protein
MLTSSRGWFRLWIALTLFLGLLCGSAGVFFASDIPKVRESVMDCGFTEVITNGVTTPGWRTVTRTAPEKGDFKVKGRVVGMWDGSTWLRQDATPRNCKENALYEYGDKEKLLAQLQKLIDAPGLSKDNIAFWLREWTTTTGFFISEDRFDYQGAFAIMSAWILFGCVVPAVGMLILGLGVRWVYRGFSTSGSAT